MQPTFTFKALRLEDLATLSGGDVARLFNEAIDEATYVFQEPEKYAGDTLKVSVTLKLTLSGKAGTANIDITPSVDIKTPARRVVADSARLQNGALLITQEGEQLTIPSTLRPVK